MKHIKFFFKSLYQNTCILLEKQKWWYALIILLMSVVISVSPLLSSGYMSNLNGLFNSQVDTAIDKGLSSFALDLDEENDIFFVDGVMTGTGKFAPKNIIEDTTVQEPNAYYTHKTTVTNEDKTESVVDFTTLRVYVLNLDVVNQPGDQTKLENFLKTSVYQEDLLKPGTPSKPQSSFFVFCKTTFYGSLYKANNTQVEDRAVGSINGNYKDETLQNVHLNTFKYRNHTSADGLATQKDVKESFITLCNNIFTPVRIESTWMQVGIQGGVNVVVAFLAGLIFFFFSRGKNSLKKYTFMESQSIAWIMCLSPAIVSALLTLLIPSLGVMSFILIISFRIFNATSKINGKYAQETNKEPVYKARQ